MYSSRLFLLLAVWSSVILINTWHLQEWAWARKKERTIAFLTSSRWTNSINDCHLLHCSSFSYSSLFEWKNEALQLRFGQITYDCLDELFFSSSMYQEMNWRKWTHLPLVLSTISNNKLNWWFWEIIQSRWTVTSYRSYDVD